MHLAQNCVRILESIQEEYLEKGQSNRTECCRLMIEPNEGNIVATNIHCLFISEVDNNTYNFDPISVANKESKISFFFLSCTPLD